MLPETVMAPELAALAPPVRVGKAVDEHGRAGKEAEDLVRVAVDELRAELDRHRHRRLVQRVNASAEARARFEKENGEAGGGEIARRREARRASADHDDVVFFHCLR